MKQTLPDYRTGEREGTNSSFQVRCLQGGKDHGRRLSATGRESTGTRGSWARENKGGKKRDARFHSRWRKEGRRACFRLSGAAKEKRENFVNSAGLGGKGGEGEGFGLFRVEVSGKKRNSCLPSTSEGKKV